MVLGDFLPEPRIIHGTRGHLARTTRVISKHIHTGVVGTTRIVKIDTFPSRVNQFSTTNIYILQAKSYMKSRMECHACVKL